MLDALVHTFHGDRQTKQGGVGDTTLHKLMMDMMMIPTTIPTQATIHISMIRMKRGGVVEERRIGIKVLMLCLLLLLRW